MADEAKKPEKKAGKVKVEWTAQGEDRGAWSEHGQHMAGEIVETDHADVLIKAGFAKAVG